MLSSLYRLLTDLGAPIINFYLYRRRLAGREDAERFSERFGISSRPRPAGRLVWCHAASVGEAMSLLLLIDRLHEIYPDTFVLMTTGTITAARMIMPRLPSYAVHQYMPIDRVPCINRFLNHWKPTAALWIESEIWPNTLAILKTRMIPVILLNARMSDNSFRNWRRAKTWAREIMSAFSLCLAQTEDDRGRFIALGARPVKCLGNLKYASAPLPYDEVELKKLSDRVGGRPLWLMASTHRGEEEMALVAHKQIAATHPNILTVIVPRHTSRGEEIAQLIKSNSLQYAQRSKGDALTEDTQIYLADTMSELGLFYRLCSVAVIGGSFVPIGGHNPIEAAQFDCAIIFGPYMFKTTGLVQEFLRAQAAVQLQHANEIAFTVDRLLTSPDERKKQAQTARLLADQKRHILDQIIDEMAPWLKS